MNSPHFTIADLDALSDLVASPGYKLLRDRFAAELERRRAELESDLGEGATGRVRGWIGALRTVLNIPQILRDEMTNQIAKDNEDGI